MSDPSRCELCGGSDPEQYLLLWNGGVLARCWLHRINVSERKDIREIDQDEAFVLAIQFE